MTKNLKIAVIFLLVLIGIYYLSNNYQSKFHSTSNQIFIKDTKDIFKLLIKNESMSIELIRNDTIWNISGNDTLVVKTRSMENLFDNILKLNRGTIISENPEKYGTYSVDDSTGIHLIITDANDETIEYYVFGRSKSDYSHCYIRIGSDPKVYLADQNVIHMLSTRDSYWGEKPKDEILPPIPADSTIIN